MKKLSSLLILFLFYANVYGQGEAAVPFLTLQQSTLLNGAGRIGAAIPVQDPTGFYYNPAQLGYFSRNNNLAVSFIPEKNRWMPRVGMDYSFQSYGAAAGYNFGKLNESFPLSIGLGYIHSKLNFGQYMRITPYTPDYWLSNDDYDAFDCFSVGAGYDYYLQFNLGFSIKTFESRFGDQPTEPGMRPAVAKGTAFDFGLMITAPMADLIFSNTKYNISSKVFIKPKADLTLGYSISNIGKKIYYVDPVQSDPIPRTARIGYTINFGLDLNGMKNNLSAIDYSFTAEAEDILIKRKQSGETEYQDILGDINLGKHLFELKGDDNVVVHRGHIVRLFDTVVIASGVFAGDGYYNIKTNSLGLSSEGIFKLLSALVDHPLFNFVADHFVVEYYDTNMFVDSGLDTNLKGMSLYFRGIEL